MKNKSVLTLLLLVTTVSGAHAGSTVNPAVPSLRDPLNSPQIQQNFQAAYNDINNLLGKYANGTAPTNPTNFQEWADTSGAPVAVFRYWNAGTATWIPYASLNIATGVYSNFATSAGFLATAPIVASVSGGVVTYSLSVDSNFQVAANKLALASGAAGTLFCNSSASTAELSVCTWSTFAARAIGSTNGIFPHFVGGVWTTDTTGVTGHAVPFLDGSNTWAALQTIYPGTATLRTALAGTLFRTAQLDGTASVNQQDSFGAAGLFTCMRSDGTAAVSTALAANDLICAFGAHGYDGVANSSVAAAFRLYASQGWSSTAHGTYARVATTANGSLSPVDQFGIEQDGGITAPPTVTGGSKGQGTFNAGVGYYINGNLFNFSNLAGSLAPSQCPNATASATGCVEGDNATLAITSGVIGVNLGHANTWTQPQTFPNNSLTLAEFPTIGANTALCSVAGGTPIACTQAQLTALINPATASLSGALPAWPNNTTTYFRGDGSYATLTIGAVAGLISAVATFLGTPSSANLLAALTTSTGSGNAVFSAGPTFTGTIAAAAATFTGTVNHTGGFQVGGNAMTFPGSAATLASLNIADQTLTGGANVTSQSLSTGSITVDCGSRSTQFITGATSAWSITAPANDGSCFVLLTNAPSSAVVPTFSGFTVGSNTGAALTTVASAKFTISIWRVNGVAAYSIFAHQ